MISEEYDDYSKKLAKCSSPIIIEESEIEQSVPIRSHDLAAGDAEVSIEDQAISVKKQWQSTVESLKRKLDHCNNLIRELHMFEEQYCSDLAFIEQGESLINDYKNQTCESSIENRISKHKVTYSSNSV